MSAVRFCCGPAGFVLPNALRAANDVRFTMLTSVLSMAFWRLGFSYILYACRWAWARSASGSPWSWTGSAA